MDFPDGSVFETQFYFQYNSQIAINRRAWKWVASIPGQPTNTTKVDAALLAASLPAAYSALLVDAAVLLGVAYKPIPNPANQAAVYSTATTTAGTAGAVSLPKQTCGLIRFKSATMGKRGEGRIYVPFPSTTSNETTGVPTAGYVANLLSLGTLLGSNLACTSTTAAAGSIQPVLIPGPGIVTPPIQVTTMLALSAWATQRRRGDFGRLNRSPF
jgi:hypothetical protein